MKRTMICLTMAALIAAGALSTTGVIYAAELSGTPSPGASQNISSAISPRAEETEWKYRIVDGRLQKRLWSITYLKWLTDWEWI